MKTKNLVEDLLKILHSLDTSNFPKDHPLRIESRGSKLGYFKSETGTKIIYICCYYIISFTGGNKIKAFCSIRAKCYTLLTEQSDGKVKGENKLKGVNKEAVKLLDLSAYLKTLLLDETQKCVSNRITSKHNNLYVQKTIKKSLCNFDNKVRIKNCGIHTSKYGSTESDSCDCAFAKCIKYKKIF